MEVFFGGEGVPKFQVKSVNFRKFFFFYQKLPGISDVYFLYCSVPSAPTNPILVIVQLLKLT